MNLELFPMGKPTLSQESITCGELYQAESRGDDVSGIAAFSGLPMPSEKKL